MFRHVLSELFYMFQSYILHLSSLAIPISPTVSDRSVGREAESSWLPERMSQMIAFLSQLDCLLLTPRLCLLENNKPPQADAGPDKELTLPVDSTTLDGSRSSDDQKIVSYLWEKTQ